MNATAKRLGLALLFTAGVIIFNGYMVLTGGADDLYGLLPGNAPQHETHAPIRAYKQTCAGFSRWHANRFIRILAMSGY
jgi:hypothetical protein